MTWPLASPPNSKTNQQISITSIENVFIQFSEYIRYNLFAQNADSAVFIVGKKRRAEAFWTINPFKMAIFPGVADQLQDFEVKATDTRVAITKIEFIVYCQFRFWDITKPLIDPGIVSEPLPELAPYFVS